MYVPLPFGLIEKNFYLFFKMFVIPSPSLLSSVPPVSFRHEVTALSVMSVCFHIDRPFCQNKILMLVSDEAKGEYRWQEENQRSERGAGRNTHNRATGGKAESKDNFPAEGKGLFSLGSARSSKMHVSPWVSSRSFTVALILARESLKVQEQWSHAASLLVYAFSNSRSSWLKAGL